MGALFFSQAGLTRAIENDFVIFDPKSRRRHRLDTGQASFQFEDPATHAAKEVMMMAFVGAFVTRHLARDFHGNHAPVLGERLEGTINRCYSKSRDFPNCEALNFWRGQRIVVLLKHGLNGPLLSRASFHASKNKGVEERDQRPDNFLSMFHRWNSCGSTPGLMMGITFTSSPPTLRAMSVAIVESDATLSSARAPGSANVRESRPNRGAEGGRECQ